jgi:stearoyl-CoA desaturase (delta-9 desaturase)
MKSKLVPDVVITYVLLHAGCLLALYTGASWRGVELFAIGYAIRSLGVGIAYHRYFAHRAFKTSRVMQFLLGLWGVLSFQKGPLWWAQTHRDHHRYTDTPQDLHSPRLQGLFYSHFVWFQIRENQEIVPAKIPDLWKFPELRLLEDWRFYFLFNLATWLALGAAFGLEGFVFGGLLPTVLAFQVVHAIQSVSHAIGGYRRCPTDDDSRNHVWIGLLSLGEWHNNHHYMMSSARQGFAWWELDVQWLVLRGLAAVGLVWDLRKPSNEVLAGDFSTAPKLAKS